MSQAENVPTTSRRALLQGAISAPAIAIPSPSHNKPAEMGPLAMDGELITLGHALRVAWARERELTALGQTVANDVWEAAYDRCAELVRQIEQCSARTMEGLRVKAFAVLWLSFW